VTRHGGDRWQAARADDDPRREPLPAGHPETWRVLTAGTVLEGEGYEYRAPAIRSDE
jgi:hypothetical protein